MVASGDNYLIVPRDKYMRSFSQVFIAESRSELETTLVDLTFSATDFFLLLCIQCSDRRSEEGTRSHYRWFCHSSMWLLGTELS